MERGERRERNLLVGKQFLGFFFLQERERKRERRGERREMTETLLRKRAERERPFYDFFLKLPMKALINKISKIKTAEYYLYVYYLIP